MIFRQLFDHDTYTFTYLLADEETREAVLIDSVDAQHKRDLKLLEELDLKLTHTLETHVHADHITGAGLLSQATGAITVVPDPAVPCADKVIKDGETISFGGYTLRAMATPGHTAHCTSYVLPELRLVFTGDALFIRGTGRTDFQGGSAEKLYHSISEGLFSLPDDYRVYPGHDYRGHTASTIGEEQLFNPRVAGKTLAEFEQIMADLNLADPKRIHEALPANQACGLPKRQSDVEGLEVTPGWLEQHHEKVRLIDVRGEDEYNGKMGHIEGAQLVPLDTLADSAHHCDDHEHFLVFVCHSGRRSLKATHLMRELGFPHSYSLKGGMVAWNQRNAVVAG
jgi:glyoxylase-like metal-dependent hydrolase (beta-lactamase superfamily II)